VAAGGLIVLTNLQTLAQRGNAAGVVVSAEQAERTVDQLRAKADEGQQDQSSHGYHRRLSQLTVPT
jgi:hypothetical protein